MRRTVFGRDARAVVVRARELAREDGAATLEAEHLLLALAERPDVPVLRDLGLDPDGVRTALELEETRALAAVGVAAGEFDLRATPALREPRWAASAKVALKRAQEVAEARRDRRIGPEHVLLGVLCARQGRVARALACVDLDAGDVRAQVEHELALAA